ncbi:MAG: preprotein translocase subunit SecA [Holosporales bacterium]
MLLHFAQKLFGSSNDRLIKKYRRQVETINALEPKISALSDTELAAQTHIFKDQLKNGQTLDDILPAAFAVVREAAKRTLGLRAFDVQLIGGMVLHSGKISEMKTGEGKTLVATFPAYLNALKGEGVHVVTVNDYLARRDSEWMAQVFRFLGLSVGCIVHGLDDRERREQYLSDITYATNNELGFDYLRDNMKFSFGAMVQRPLSYAIIDEVDSILIDEARTPLIISGPGEGTTDLYIKLDAVVRLLPAAECFEVDEKQKSATFSEAGQIRLEEVLREKGLINEGSGLYDISNISVLHHATQAMRAHALFEKDKEYIVKDKKVYIIDEFTGRMMEGRRYSDGLHQAIEAKEGVPVQMENQTLASITFQNYFRLYKKLSGMTGTAMTEAAEFGEIYTLDVVEIPTNVTVARQDDQDVIYRSEAEKNQAILAQIEECYGRGQPVLVGTVSIAKSESLSAFLTKKKIKHEVLNARFHEQEATIIAQAGKPGAITIATNMAGRGTDIQLGGNLALMVAEGGEAARAVHQAAKEKVLAAGGLFVIGSERHESRRIDNQLRGRSGRQGDPGRSKFFICLEDDLMRIFGSQKIDPWLTKLGLEENEPITHPFLTKALERAQKKVEARNFDIRKNLLKYDDVMNDQRKVIYEQRREIMGADSVADTVDSFRADVVESMVARHIPAGSYHEEWDGDGLAEEVKMIFGLELPVAAWAAEEGVADSEIKQRLAQAVEEHMQRQRSQAAPELWNHAEKSLLLQVLDQVWKDHLLTLDQLRQGINWRAYGQRDPLQEYKREAFENFQGMLEKLKETLTQLLARLEVRSEPLGELEAAQQEAARRWQESRADVLAGDAAETAEPAVASNAAAAAALDNRPFDQNDPTTWGRTARNEPCPCGSGKKYKHCHGAV